MRTVLVCLLSAASIFAADAPSLERARHSYSRTEYGAALKILQALPAKNDAAYLLMGQCYYMQGDPKKASELLQKAVELAPTRSEYWMWLGRAYGRRAETSSFITAPGYASKTRQYFEKAVQLDPANLEATSDLFEYYLEAPGFLGGGLDKAAELSKRIGQMNPSEYYWAQSRLAEKRKEFQTAEQQLRRAADLAPRQVGRLIDLAKFFSKAGRYNESDDAFARAEKIDPNAPKLLFERASTYIRAKRNLEMARELLKRYLQCTLTPDDPPKREAEELLKSI